MNLWQNLAPAFLTAFAFWMQLSLGALGILLIHDVTGGKWGDSFRPHLLRTFPTLYLMLIAFLLISLASPWIYPWVAHPSKLLNRPFFLVRGLLYFTSWIVIARGYRSRRASGKNTRAWSGGSLLVLLFSVTFASMDWLMTLNPRWGSTGFGVLFIAGALCAGFSFIALVATTIEKRASSPDQRKPVLIDIGNLILMSVMFWAYVEFMQYLIIWSGQLPEEVKWYSVRAQGGWQSLLIATLALGFAFPFLCLLFRNFKKTPRLLALAATMILAGRFFENLILVAPAHDFPAAMGTLLGVSTCFVLGMPWLGLYRAGSKEVRT